MHRTPLSVAAELAKEARMGAESTESTQREVRRIDLSDFEASKYEIANQLWNAAVEIGFFQVTNHGIAQSNVDRAFTNAERFFDLPDAVKAQWPHKRNAGWESKAQVRPSTGTPDQEESYQVPLPRMQGLWPSDAELPGFEQEVKAFESQCWHLGMRLMSCFAYKMGFAEDFFSHAHKSTSPGYQSTLRMLHYFGIDRSTIAPGTWRAGAHTDFDMLTLLFQKQGQGGLQVRPGKDMDSGAWTSVEPVEGVVTCNIGDMLMCWSDAALPSNFHRVRFPKDDEHFGPRYSLAFVCQANEEAIIEGPQKKYAAISGADYLRERITANFKKY